MSTHSFIGLIKGDRRIHYVYCHMDGYPGHQLPLLTAYYNSPEAVSDLIALGELVVLDATPDTSVAFHRDRGARLRIYSAASLQELFKTEADNAEYFYLYEPEGGWRCYDYKGEVIV